MFVPVSHIEWPTDGTDEQKEKFWKRIKKVMPKNRSRPSQQNDYHSSKNGKLSSEGFFDLAHSRTVNEQISGVYFSMNDKDEEIYDVINEQEMEECIDPGYETCSDTKKDDESSGGTYTGNSTDSTVDSGVVNDSQIHTAVDDSAAEAKEKVNADAKTVNGIDSSRSLKQREYMNILRVEL